MIGLRSDSIEPANTASSLGIHEVRTSQSLGVDSFTHLEVPQEKVAETQSILAETNIGLPVFAIEDAEAYVSTVPFLTLVRPASVME